MKEYDRVPDSPRRSFFELTGFTLLLIAFGLLPSASVTQSAHNRSPGASGKSECSAAW